ncbi:hypothetical protein Y032_0002g799 [Ancylostoma ceylanicum]|uniref:Uncharacterized protein n=1 Tax=Ancylostoma ceylanicum TaxID=53326 RepID=A0A016W1H3_9BILA|nr:hypothetical protein Y032_0002g799 [Ancylostoma ceylanicum]
MYNLRIGNYLLIAVSCDNEVDLDPRIATIQEDEVGRTFSVLMITMLWESPCSRMRSPSSFHVPYPKPPWHLYPSFSLLRGPSGLLRQ